MRKEILLIGMLFLAGGLLAGGLAYYAASHMISNTPDRGAATSGAPSPDEVQRQ